MTINEFIEMVKAENGITYETKDILSYIVSEARRKKSAGCAVLDDESVRNLILNYSPDKKPTSETSVKTVTVEEAKKEAITEAKKEKKKEEPKKKEWEQVGLGFFLNE